MKIELSAVLSNVNFASAALAKVLFFGLFDHGLLYFLWMVHSFQKFQNAIFLEIFEIPAIG